MLNRRTLLLASTQICAPLGLSQLLVGGERQARRPARSTILFFLCGGASHIDTWDMKPQAAAEYRGPFQPISTTAPAIQLCEHLPQTAKIANHLAVIRSITDFGRATGDHHAGYYYNLTGRVPDTTFRTQGNDR